MMVLVFGGPIMFLKCCVVDFDITDDPHGSLATQDILWFCLSKMLCSRSICLCEPVTMFDSAIGIVVSVCFLPDNMKLMWPIYYCTVFAFLGVICFWPLKRWSNICSPTVRPFVCFYSNKSTRNDYAHCTVNVFMCNARRLWARGSSLSMCHIPLPHPLRVFTKVGAHWNNLVVDLGGRAVRWIWFRGIGRRGTEVSLLKYVFPEGLFCGCGQYGRAWEMQSAYDFVAH